MDDVAKLKSDFAKLRKEKKKLEVRIDNIIQQLKCLSKELGDLYDERPQDE